MRRRTLVEWSTLKLSVSIRIVKLSSPSTAAKSAWLPKSYGRPLPGLSSNGVARFETGKPFPEPTFADFVLTEKFAEIAK
ncbi:hypothetical protein HNY73_017783 [Argiope bruennichi]|uniref:Uncharacterized protein n=1 Tax=Argiope bruennichi TaxID=94029 RepID=A0A8T0EB41_ARGBR|nr:hypothetical protein HNY73_017783 [Argiope bruennichi]